MRKIWTTPAIKCPILFEELLSKSHVLIAGQTNSGKSVTLNGIIYTALQHSPAKVEFILIDPKRVELKDYAKLPHTIAHAAGHNPNAWRKALQKACDIMDARYNSMDGKMYDGPDLYVVIDEFADIKISGGKECFNAVLRLLSEGRAARVHCLIATQTPKAEILPTVLRANIPYRIALRTNTANESRLIMDHAGCEDLPEHGQGYYYKPGKDAIELYNLPYIQEDKLNWIVNYWTHTKPKIKVFA